MWVKINSDSQSDPNHQQTTAYLRPAEPGKHRSLCPQQPQKLSNRFTLRGSPYINNTSLPIVLPIVLEFGPIDASLYGTIGADEEEESRRIRKKIDAPKGVKLESRHLPALIFSIPDPSDHHKLVFLTQCRPHPTESSGRNNLPNQTVPDHLIFRMPTSHLVFLRLHMLRSGKACG